LKEKKNTANPIIIGKIEKKEGMLKYEKSWGIPERKGLNKSEHSHRVPATGLNSALVISAERITSSTT
jgi:hypothetical protein